MTDPYAQARAEIRPTKEAIEHDLLEKKNVVGVDIAEKVTGGQKTGELSIVGALAAGQFTAAHERFVRAPRGSGR